MGKKHFLILFFCMFVDQLHKFYMIDVYNIISKGVVEVTSFYNHVMVWNRGISFGMFQNHEYSNIFFLFFASLVILFILYLINNSKDEIEKIFLSVIVGGALGNIIDRIRFKAVADFFDFHIAGYHWPAFNIADSFVFIGAFGLIGYTLFFGSNENEKSK